MAGALGGMFANQPPGPPPPGPPGGVGPAGLIPPPTGPRNPNNTLVDELEASFEVPGGGGGGEGGGKGGGQGSVQRRALTSALPSPQACFASLVSQDYVNGTDQEEIRTGEARRVAELRFVAARSGYVCGWESVGSGVVRKGSILSVRCIVSLTLSRPLGLAASVFLVQPQCTDYCTALYHYRKHDKTTGEKNVFLHL